jgi:hypothetical protein
LWEWLVMPFGLKMHLFSFSESWTRFSKGQIF